MCSNQVNAARRPRTATPRAVRAGWAEPIWLARRWPRLPQSPAASSTSVSGRDPMEPFTRHTGVAVPLPRSNVDTDQIIPKQFLKRIERTGFGKFAFFDWRFNADGAPKPDFELNLDRYRGASVLLAGTNFGCGSSREHAVWAL